MAEEKGVRVKRWIISCALFLFSLNSLADGTTPFDRQWKDESWKTEAGSLAIQAGGRLKPLDTFARECVALFLGKESYKGKDSVEILFSLVFEPQNWQEIPFIQVSHKPLKKDLGLDSEKSLFMSKEIMHSVRLMPLIGELQSKQKAQEKLDPYFQAVLRLANQLSLLQELISGRALRFIPPDAEALKTSDAWFGFDRYSDEQKLKFALMAASFTSNDEAIKAKLPEYVKRFREMAQNSNSALYPPMKNMQVEVHFNHLRPFRVAWILALSSILLLALSFYSEKKAWYLVAMSLFGGSFIFQIYGFALRCWIAGRPPVSNMYESVIWVAFGTMLLGLILEIIYRKKVIALGALVFCTIALIISDAVSGVLDNGIHPLEPVLRSNLWLTIHVMTITLGYAAFSLSMILGNFGLGQAIFFGKESKNYPYKILSFYAYRAVQVGVILLAAGTILGGVWADYSWGRFWGWDPKETWALIALLGYLALIHARFRGMVGPFGFLAGCVSAFMGVLMAWYGVNFVLGAGLHSYGFSSGGVAYMATYVSVQLFFVLYAYVLKKNKSAA